MKIENGSRQAAYEVDCYKVEKEAPFVTESYTTKSEALRAAKQKAKIFPLVEVNFSDLGDNFGDGGCTLIWSHNPYNW